MVVAFTLNVISVLWIICNPSTTFGQHSTGLDVRDTFGEDDGEDNGEVRNGLLLLEELEGGGGGSSGGVLRGRRIGGESDVVR